MYKIGKRIVFFLTLATLILFSNMVAFAGQWIEDSNGWWFDNGNGTWPANSWQWIDGNNDGIAECYYFDQYGYCLINTITPDGYQVDHNGAWIVNGVIQVKTTESAQTSSLLSEEQSQYLLDIIEPYQKGGAYQDHSLFSMGGKQYGKGFVTWGWDSETYFNLEGKYSKISFITGIVSPTWNYASVEFAVYADDEPIASYEMGMSDLPITHTLDIEGCHKLMFYVNDNYNASGTGRYGIADIIVN